MQKAIESFSRDVGLPELHRFKLGQFRLLLEAAGALRLPPYKGSTFRGALGFALKELLCEEPERPCETCRRPDRCGYSYLFETNRGNFQKERGEAVPHPYVLTPPLTAKEDFAPGERLICGLILVGDAYVYLYHVLNAMMAAGQFGVGRGRGKFELVEAACMRPTAPPTIVYRRGRTGFQHPGPPLTGEQLLSGCRGLRVRRATLRFQTPARVKSEKRFVKSLQFPVLIRALLRRTYDLLRFHLDCLLAADLGALIERASAVRTARDGLRWRDWARYSSRQSEFLKMGGLMGEVAYEGDLTPFVPLLTLGQWIHVGKGTSLGLGKYQITEMEHAP